MQLQIINPTPLRRDNEYKYNVQIRKTETMFLKFLSNFFWLKKWDNEHSLAHLSSHLKRDIGLIEQDINPRNLYKKSSNISTIRASVWQ